MSGSIQMVVITVIMYNKKRCLSKFRCREHTPYPVLLFILALFKFSPVGASLVVEGLFETCCPIGVTVSIFRDDHRELQGAPSSMPSIESSKAPRNSTIESSKAPRSSKRLAPLELFLMSNCRVKLKQDVTNPKHQCLVQLLTHIVSCLLHLLLLRRRHLGCPAKFVLALFPNTLVDACQLKLPHLLTQTCRHFAELLKLRVMCSLPLNASF